MWGDVRQFEYSLITGGVCRVLCLPILYTPYFWGLVGWQHKSCGFLACNYSITDADGLVLMRVAVGEPKLVQLGVRCL